MGMSTKILSALGLGERKVSSEERIDELVVRVLEENPAIAARAADVLGIHPESNWRSLAAAGLLDSLADNLNEEEVMAHSTSRRVRVLVSRPNGTWRKWSEEDEARLTPQVQPKAASYGRAERKIDNPQQRSAS